MEFAISLTIENLKQSSYLKCSYLKMGSHGNALAVAFFSRRAHLRSCAHDFHYSIEKRCGKLGCYISLNEIHVLYRGTDVNCPTLHYYNLRTDSLLWKTCLFWNCRHFPSPQGKKFVNFKIVMPYLDTTKFFKDLSL